MDIDYSVITKNNPAVLSVVDDNDCAISMTDLVSVNSRKEQDLKKELEKEKPKFRRGKNDRSPGRSNKKERPRDLELDDVKVNPVAPFSSTTKNSRTSYQPVLT